VRKAFCGKMKRMRNSFQKTEEDNIEGYMLQNKGKTIREGKSGRKE
jgi:hypothetical protein